MTSTVESDEFAGVIEECNEKVDALGIGVRPSLEMPSGLERNAQEAWKRFVQSYKREARKNDREALNVLVWGPSVDVGNAVARKRYCIRHALRRLGHVAFFSEELVQSSHPSQISMLQLDEQLQARAVDLIIVLLEDSNGARHETLDHWGDTTLPKLLVMAPEGLKSSYLGSFLKNLDEGHGGVYWYGAGALESCDVLTRAIKRAEARRTLRRVMRGRRR